MTEISRYPPVLKSHPFPESRISDLRLDEINKLRNNVAAMENFTTLMNGFNFETNRKINIGGRVFEKIYDKHFQKAFRSMKEEAIRNLDIDEYKKQNIVAKNEWLAQCKIIDDYNDKVKKIKIQIESLTNWNDYITFENKKYGIYRFHNNIHYENNCNGVSTRVEDYVSCECSSCRSWFGCGRGPNLEYKHECTKCKTTINTIE